MEGEAYIMGMVLFWLNEQEQHTIYLFYILRHIDIEVLNFSLFIF